MASSNRYCPQCGMPVAAGQGFCSNCGATMDMNMAYPTARAPGGNVPPPPPGTFPPGSSTAYTQYPSSMQGGMQSAPGYPTPPPPATVPTYPGAEVPSYAKPQKGASKGMFGKISCGVLVVILLIVGLCGGASYVGYRYISSVGSTAGTTTNTGTHSGNSSSNTPTSSQVITKQINQTITYASVEMTIQSVQQASSFSDDTFSSSNGVVRINVKENNTATGGSFAYNDVLRLILPDKSSIAPSDTKEPTNPQAQTTQQNWWDFPVSTSVPIDKVMLQLGKSTEAQMQVPLTGNADLSQYQPKTANLNAQTQYQGLNWTMTSAVKSWSGYGQQAPQGQRYVTVTLKMDNNSSQSFSAYYGNYARLKSGSNSSSPTSDSTLPTNVPAGSTGATGTLVFLMPDSSTSFSLILLGNTTASPPISQATINFQIA